MPVYVSAHDAAVVFLLQVVFRMLWDYCYASVTTAVSVDVWKTLCRTKLNGDSKRGYSDLILVWGLFLSLHTWFFLMFIIDRYGIAKRTPCCTSWLDSSLTWRWLHQNHHLNWNVDWLFAFFTEKKPYFKWSFFYWFINKNWKPVLNCKSVSLKVLKRFLCVVEYLLERLCSVPSFDPALSYINQTTIFYMLSM